MLLEAFEVSEGQAVTQESFLDGMKGVDGRAIGIEGHQTVVIGITHLTITLSKPCDRRMT